MANEYMKKMLNSYIIKEKRKPEKNQALLLDVLKERHSDWLLRGCCQGVSFKNLTKERFLASEGTNFFQSLGSLIPVVPNGGVLTRPRERR